VATDSVSLKEYLDTLDPLAKKEAQNASSFLKTLQKKEIYSLLNKA
jgi:hypothetical protein